MDIGNRCVCCGEDTSFGSGNFVNRIPADADYESLDEQGNVIFADGQYRDGWLCEECQQLECDKCSKLTIDYSFGRTVDGKYYDVVCSDCAEHTIQQIENVEDDNPNSVGYYGYNQKTDNYYPNLDD